MPKSGPEMAMLALAVMHLLGCSSADLRLGEVGPAVSAGAGTSGTLPGDVASAAGTPLVAAHSMTRALFASYSGSLFQVSRSSDSQTQDIGVTSAGGYADMDTLNQFCSGSTCTVSKLYDQTENANDLTQALQARQPLLAYWSIANATVVPMAVTVTAQYLRNRTNTRNIPTGAGAQTQYAVFHGLYTQNTGCCYDYGNMQVTLDDKSDATMNALYFGADTAWGSGAGSGPWAMVDYNNGLFGSGSKSSANNPSVVRNLVTVLSKTNGTTSWALKIGDASGGQLDTYWNAGLPNGYSPLKQQGGLSLAEGGGTGSDTGSGAFFEGVVIAAVTSEVTDNSIQANLASVYGSRGTSAFSPLADTALLAWWDGNDKSTLTLSSGSVKSWVDKSANGYVVSQGTASRQPAYFEGLLNGKGGLRFSRAKDSLLTSLDDDRIFADGFSIYFVIQPTSVPANYQSLLTQSTSTRSEPGLGLTAAGTTASPLAADFGFSQVGSSTLANTPLVPYIEEFVSSAGAPIAGGNFTVTPYVNGVPGDPVTQTNLNAYTATGVHIGSDRFDDSYDGYLYEVVASSDTTPETRQKYEQYLGTKYGLLGFLPPGN